MSADLVLSTRPRDVGSFVVRRALPQAQRRLVGPFIFFDHFGPIRFPPGEGMDVRPHPHINLATVTYLFDGEIVHRDSLGYVQAIRPGALNWMTAGRGIVHSERTSVEARKLGARAHGIQCWVALPKSHEEVEPSFHHHDSAALPMLERGGATLRVIAGTAYGASSPAIVHSPMFYVDATFESGGELALPDEYPERGAYVVEGAVQTRAGRIEEGSMIVFGEASGALLSTESRCRLMLLGGAPLDGERHLWWNFASSSLERIEQAKRDWKEGRFPKVPGDDQEFIPLPES